jgi:phosphoglycolate phosphatase
MLCLFDLDGTLIDSEAGIFAGIRYSLERMQVPVPAPDALRRWIGPPLRQNFAHVLAADRVERGVALYREYFEATGWLEHTVYAGIPELLANLKSQGHTLVVVTSKVDVHAHRVVASLAFGDLFSAVYAPGPDSMTSEKASMVAAALADFSGNKNTTVMIGDRYYDIDAPAPTAFAASACSGVSATSTSCERPVPTRSSALSMNFAWRYQAKSIAAEAAPAVNADLCLGLAELLWGASRLKPLPQ